MRNDVRAYSSSFDFQDRNLDGKGQVLAIQERPLLKKLLGSWIFDTA